MSERAGEKKIGCEEKKKGEERANAPASQPRLLINIAVKTTVCSTLTL